MITPVPTKVADPKDAVLWSILNRLETIDESPSTRVSFGTGILYNAQYGLLSPLFDSELEQIRDVLKIKKLEEPESTLPPATREGYEATAETTIRDI